MRLLKLRPADIRDLSKSELQARVDARIRSIKEEEKRAREARRREQNKARYR